MTQYRVKGQIDFIRFASHRPDGSELWELGRIEVATDVEATDPAGAEAVALDIAGQHLESPDWSETPEVALVDQVAQMALPMEVAR